MGQPRRRVRAMIAVIGVVGWLLDFASKQWAIANLDPDNPPSFLGGFLKFRLIFNPGAAFSMGTDLTLLLSIFALVALVATVFFVAPRVRRTSVGVAVGLLIAGIAGNLTDRLFRAPGPFHGHVVDFISLPRFAIFNVADICITSAAVLLVLLSFLDDGKSGEQVVARKETAK